MQVRGAARWIAVLAAAVPQPAMALSDGAVFAGAQALSDADLAAQRGGFIGPGGLQMDLRIQLDTLVNGTLVLRSVLNPEVPLSAGLQVYAPDGPPPATAESIPQAGAAVLPAPSVAVAFERSTGTTIIAGGPPVPQVKVTGVGAVYADAAPQLAIVPDGAPVSAAGGTVRARSTPTGALVTFDSNDLQVRHVLGTAAVNAVANIASDRVIDTMTAIGIGLPNASIMNIGSTAARIDDTILNALRGLSR